MTSPSMTDDATAQKLQRLRALLREMDSVLVCYSGGIDSAFVLAVATEELGERAVGMTAVSPSLSPSEKDDAQRIAEGLGPITPAASPDSALASSTAELKSPGCVARKPTPPSAVSLPKWAETSGKT